MDLVGVVYLTKGLIGANLEPLTGWSQEKRGSEVGLIQGQTLGLGRSSSMCIMIGTTYSPYNQQGCLILHY